MPALRALLTATCVLLLWDKSGTTAGIEPQPNIVLFLADDLGYGDLGCYGNAKVSTPNIDGLAKDGIRFTRMYSEPGDASARAAILTGRYPVRYGMVRETRALPILRSADFHSVAQPGGLNGVGGPMLPTLLKSAGYQQALIGKWHLGVGQNWEHLPINLGFDLFYGTPLSHGPPCTENEELRITDFQMISSFFKRLLPLMVSLLFTGYLGMIRQKLAIFLFGVNCLVIFLYGLYLSFAVFNPKSCILMENTSILEQPYKEENMTQRMTQRALNFITSSSKNEEPFFVFVSYLQPSYPPIVSPRFNGSSGLGQYYDSVKELDWSIGVIVNKLKEQHIYKDTLIIFASDNGVALSHPLTKTQYPNHLHGSPKYFTGHSYDVITLRGEKQTVWEGGIRVPAIMTWPRVIKSDQQVSKPVSLLDLLPTIRNFVANDYSLDEVDGQDIAPLIKHGDPTFSHRPIMHHCDTGNVSAVTFKRYKLHMSSCDGEFFNPPLLFDIEKDPGELQNLSGHDEVVQEIQGAIREHQSTLSRTPSQFTQLLRPWLYLCHSPPFCKKEIMEPENFEDLFQIIRREEL